MTEIAPGAYHLPHFLDRPATGACGALPCADGRRRAGVRADRAGGGKMHVRMLCLGRHWNAKTYQYETTRADYDNLPAPPLPVEFRRLAQEIAATAGMTIDQTSASSTITAPEAAWDLHQDKDEGKASIEEGIPVVSVSLGDTAKFLFGGSEAARPDLQRSHSSPAMPSSSAARHACDTTASHVLRPSPPRRSLTGASSSGRFNLDHRAGAIPNPITQLQCLLPPMPRIVVVGAGAAGSDGRDLCGVARRRTCCCSSGRGMGAARS